ncbi:hypothetical protein ACFLZV_02065 [Candidatus Margulisiibacteriota bacterium]
MMIVFQHDNNIKKLAGKILDELISGAEQELREYGWLKKFMEIFPGQIKEHNLVKKIFNEIKAIKDDSLKVILLIELMKSFPEKIKEHNLVEEIFNERKTIEDDILEGNYVIEFKRNFPEEIELIKKNQEVSFLNARSWLIGNLG